MRLIACGAAAVVLLSSTVRAQDQPAEIRALASALVDEQARIAELRAELERRSSVLADLSSRLEHLAPTAAPSAQTVTPADQATTASPAVPAPSAPAVPRFDFYGDTKVRYETLTQDYAGCVGCPNRKRGRLRLRLGVAGRLSPDFTAAMGFSVGELNDPNSVYVNFGNKFSRKVATWDRGYVEYRPVKAPWLDLTAGKFPYTWIRSSMSFDVDFYPEGLSERLSFALKHAGPLTNVGVQGFQLLVAEQAGDLQTKVIGEQITGGFRVGNRVSTQLAVTAVDITRPDPLLRALMDGSDVGVRNTNAVVVRDGQAFYASGFRYANLIVENTVRTTSAAWPVTVGFELQRNLEAASARDSAKSFRVDVGRAQLCGDWGLSWHIFRVEQDAILAAFGESDWRAPSNVLQQRFEVNRVMNRNVQLGVTLYRGRTLDGTLPGALLAPNLPPSVADPWTNRFYFDVTYRY
jgi:hypothetical protein